MVRRSTFEGEIARGHGLNVEFEKFLVEDEGISIIINLKTIPCNEWKLLVDVEKEKGKMKTHFVKKSNIRKPKH